MVVHNLTKAVDHCPFSEVILYWLRYVWGSSGSKCISSLVKSIGGKRSVRCTEGLLLEVLLYTFYRSVAHKYVAPVEKKGVSALPPLESKYFFLITSACDFHQTHSFFSFSC